MLSITFCLHVYLIRFIASLSFYLDRQHSLPIPAPPSFTFSIPTADNKSTIKLYFYTPSTYDRTSPTPHGTIINFHGGAWTYGSAQNDARFAASVTEAGYTFISVSYRLFPEHVHPTQLDDCTAAVLWAKEHAKEYGIGKIVLCGWSAGGQLALTTAMKVAGEVDLAGIVSVYPLVDFTIPRQEKEERCRVAGEKSRTPRSWKKISELYREAAGKESEGPWGSPGLAPDQMLRDGLPDKVVLYACEWDELCEETEVFRERLRGLGKIVGGYMVKEVVHAWDKFPGFKKGDRKRDEMYAHAIEELKGMF
ncbi:alpha/beta-hydrolase [Stipitochalara longipes BDJ]|nr:alpha/beta-hydrolase [Stipitochalara longipes BDJ]